ncbi:MAG: glutamyl-tRNA synthetase [Planctomycetota bacterium]|jgi:glutamyl-tRNA synthetase
MEDLDTSRVKPGMRDACLRDLEWLGLDWDGAVEQQSDYQDEFYEVALQLQCEGLAYPCVCTRREVQAAQSAPHAEDAESIYPGTCRGKFTTLEEARLSSGREPALRLHVAPGDLSITDQLSGNLTQDVRLEVGDFPLTSRDGQIAYQLSVVLDDARQGITEVLRGDDLLSSTPRQVLLQNIFGFPTPTWIHVPLVLDAQGERLAKRHDALSIAAVRSAGISPEAFATWVAQSAGMASAGLQAASEWTKFYNLASLPLAPIRLPPEPLSGLQNPLGKASQ